MPNTPRLLHKTDRCSRWTEDSRRYLFHFFLGRSHGAFAFSDQARGGIDRTPCCKLGAAPQRHIAKFWIEPFKRKSSGDLVAQQAPVDRVWIFAGLDYKFVEPRRVAEVHFAVLRELVRGVFSEPAVIGLAFLAFLGWIIWRAYKRGDMQAVVFGLLWFLIALVPTSIVALGEVENDHRMFFPYVGLTLAVVAAAAQYLNQRVFFALAIAATSSGVAKRLNSEEGRAVRKNSASTRAASVPCALAKS